MTPLCDVPVLKSSSWSSGSTFTATSKTEQAKPNGPIKIKLHTAACDLPRQLQLQFIVLNHVLYICFLHLCCELRWIRWRRLRCKQPTRCGDAEPEGCHTGDGRADITSASNSSRIRAEPNTCCESGPRRRERDRVLGGGVYIAGN
jgi:hypothetical protein